MTPVIGLATGNVINLSFQTKQNQKNVFMTLSQSDHSSAASAANPSTDQIRDAKIRSTSPETSTKRTARPEFSDVSVFSTRRSASKSTESTVGH